MAMADIKAGGAYVELLLRDKAFLARLKSAGQSLKSFGSEIAGFGRQLMTISASMMLPVALAGQTFANFDDKMREVKAVTQATGDEFLKLSVKAKTLGASTSFTAVQVGGLMAELGRAGFKPDQVEKMTGAVLDLARATSTDAVEASGIMAASIRQFGLEAGDATRVADALTAAANKSFNTVGSLGESLSYAGPVAADFNMSIEETLAILGALGNVGIQGSNAGTAVRRLLTLTGAEAKKLEGIFGVTFVDAAGNARPLVDTLDEVNRATAGLGTAARAAKFNEAFGLLGITGASAISKTAVSVRELQRELQNASGIAAKTAEEMDKGVGGALRIMWSAIEAVNIEIGSAFGPQLQAGADKIVNLANVVIVWVQNNQQMIATAIQWVAAIGAFGAALFAMGTTISVVGSAMTVLSTIGTALGAVFVAVTSPIGLVVAAVVGLGVAIAQNSEVVNAFKIMVSTAWEAIKSVTLSVWGAISGTVLGVWNAITSATATALNWLQQSVITAFSAITFAITEWKALLYTAMIGATLAVVRFAGQLKWIFTEVIPTTLLWLYNNWRDIFTDLVNMVATVAGNIWTNLVNLKDAIAGWFSGDGFDFKWTKLTDGFESSIKELPKILQREKGPLERALERELGDIVLDVGQKWNAHNSKFRKQIAPKAKASPTESVPAPTQQELDRQKKLEAAGGAGMAGLAANGGATGETFVSFSAAALAAQGGGGTQEKIAKKLEDRDRKQTRWEEQMLVSLEKAFAIGP